MLISSIIIITANCSEDPHVIYPNEHNLIQKALSHQERTDYEKSRDKQRKAEAILAIAAIKPGMKVADLDAGSGYYSELFSYLIGDEGRVYLQNAPRYTTNNGDKLTKRLENNRLSNVVRLDSEFNNLKLPNDLDLIFIGLAFHDVYVNQKNPEWNGDPKIYIKQLYDSLSEDGKLLIIDHNAPLGSDTKHTNKLHRIDELFVISQLESVGFKLVLSSDILRNPEDDMSVFIWDENVFRKTDRFVLLFSKGIN